MATKDDTAEFSSRLDDLEAQSQEIEEHVEQMFNQIATDIYIMAEEKNTPDVLLPYVNDLTAGLQERLVVSPLVTQPLACGKGCGYCCHLPVLSPPQVIAYIADQLRTRLSEAEQAELRAAMTSYAAALEKVPEAERQIYRKACPFLASDASCQIYDIRPLACRAFTSPDVAYCRQSVAPGTEQGSPVPQHPLVYRLYQAATAGLMADAKQADETTEQVYFIPALLEALGEP